MHHLQYSTVRYHRVFDPFIVKYNGYPFNEIFPIFFNEQLMIRYFSCIFSHFFRPKFKVRNVLMSKKPKQSKKDFL